MPRRRVRRRSATTTLRATQTKARAAGRWFGIGIACYAELTGIGSRISVAPGMPINTGTETAIDPHRRDRRASRPRSASPRTARAWKRRWRRSSPNISASASRTSASIHGDSAAVSGGTGTYASRSLVLAGGAATLAAQAVRDKVLNAASHLLEAAPADLVAEDGRITVAGTDRTVTFREVARAVYSEIGRLPPDARDELAATKTYDPVFGTTTSATHIAAVEIDPETYEVRIDQFVVAEDCGKLVNPLIVDGQVHGGVAQGIGAALYEEVIYDEQGQMQTASLVDYLVPSAMRNPADAGRASGKRVADHARRLSRHGRRRHYRRAGGDRQCHRPTRCRRSASRSTNCRRRRSGCSA